MTKSIELILEVQRTITTFATPTDDDINCWIMAVLKTPITQKNPPTHCAEITIRIVDEAESAALNHTYRHKAGPTNVLSFPYDVVLPGQNYLLGDLILCAPLVVQEAVDQGKATRAHWAHLVIHGVLHLFGYDHHTDAQALVMERLETEILRTLGFADPYEMLLS